MDQIYLVRKNNTIIFACDSPSVAEVVARSEAFTNMQWGGVKIISDNPLRICSDFDTYEVERVRFFDDAFKRFNQDKLVEVEEVKQSSDEQVSVEKKESEVA